MISLLKQEIRKQILLIRKSIPLNQRKETEEAIKIKLTNFLLTTFKKNSSIAIYYPIGSELSIIEIVKDLPYKFLLPVISKDSKILKFYPWQYHNELINSPYAKTLFEPKIKEKSTIPDIVIAPLIACDLIGHRIGHGKAMYDNTIAYLQKMNPNLIYVGVCYDFQIVNNIPTEEHDQKLDYILSERRALFPAKLTTNKIKNVRDSW